MNNYTTIYDLSTETYSWERWLFFGVLLVAALIGYFFFPDWHYRVKFLGLAALVGFLTGGEYLSMCCTRSKLTSGDYTVVSGPVTNYWTYRDYRTKTDINHETVREWYECEGFQVNSVKFSYIIGNVPACFRNGKKPRLRIYDGLAMRIQYYPDTIIGGSPVNRILKLEINPYSLQPAFSTTEPTTAALR